MTHYIKNENNKIIIGTNNIDRLTIDNNGNIGIGTTNPTSILDINGKLNHKNSFIYKTASAVTSVSNGVVMLSFDITQTSFGSDMTISDNTYTTINTDGLYLVDVSTGISAGSASNKELWIRHTNSSGTELGRYGHRKTNTTLEEGFTSSSIINCSSTDRIYIVGYTNITETTNFNIYYNTNKGSYLKIYRLGNGY